MKQTDKNLRSDAATKALMRWLIAAALDNTFVTYGAAQRRLQEEVGFKSIARPGRTGVTAGAMIDRLLEVDQNAPLLNALLVEQNTKLPSDGAGWYLANRFDEPLLKQAKAKERYSKLWRRTFDKAAGEVYAAPEKEWRRLFEAVYNQPLDAHEIEHERKTRQEGSERDGLKSERSGEGRHHRDLRLWVYQNPKNIHRKYAEASPATEFILESADRVDVLFKTRDEVAAVEVKSRDSNLNDLRRGVYQCIKYRAVLSAMDIRESHVVTALLVTEIELPGEIKALLKLHQIKHFLAPMDRA